MTTDAQTEQAIANMVVRTASQFAEGKAKSDIVATLEKDGWPNNLAEKIADRGEEVKRAEFRKRGRTTLLIGAGMLGLGIAITAGSYNAATSGGGGHYVITSGLIMVGAWLILKGIWRSMAG